MPWLERLRARVREPVDPAGLALHRILFGTLVCVGSLRFVAEGWVERFYGAPTFFFKYFGFAWVAPMDAPSMRLLYLGMAGLGALIALGLFHRLAALAFFVAFTYAELTDVTYYLNHYYLVSLLALLHAAVPSHAALSLDARWFGSGRSTVPRLAHAVMRAQVGIVYVYAAVAKAGPDWLLHGQPLELWMASRTDVPLFGPLVALPYVPLLMSWAGFLNDALAVPLLLAERTRRWGFAMVFTFHGLTGMFFNIGVFPYLMMINATLWLAPDWPRRLLPARAERPAASPPGRLAMLAAAVFVTVQALVPLRTFAYGGNVLWHEQGMRWSWRVMLRSKPGDVVYRVALTSGRTMLAFPHDYLTPQQEREMSGQPDLILQLAHHVARDVARTHGTVRAVYADAWVALNGRPPARLIRPDVDLLSIDDGFGVAHYVAPEPTTSPLHLHAPRALAASAAGDPP